MRNIKYCLSGEFSGSRGKFSENSGFRRIIPERQYVVYIGNS